MKKNKQAKDKPTGLLAAGIIGAAVIVAGQIAFAGFMAYELFKALSLPSGDFGTWFLFVGAVILLLEVMSHHITRSR